LALAAVEKRKANFSPHTQSPKQIALAVLSTCVVIGAAHAAPNDATDATDATRKANDALLSYLTSFAA
jgi:hypothetical protein